MLSRVILRDPQQNCWFEYKQPQSVIHTKQIADVAPKLAEIESIVERDGLYAAGFITYEAAAAFDSHLITYPPANLPLLCFGLFKDRTRLDTLPREQEQDLDKWQIETDSKEHAKHVLLLKRHIEAGDTYQVNYTTRMWATGRVDLGTFSRMAQQAPYGAYLDGEEFTIVSASPELFFQRDGSRLLCKPMKGTAARGLSSKADLEKAEWLRSSEKNQAENLMITDMVRNDLSRIANKNSVQVSDLFHVEQYPTVWQMTSTVTAESDVSTQSLFNALFPGASITGAPKKASMDYINQYETSQREIYTGAIGLIAPDSKALFNIAIRTAWTNKRTNISHYGSGGGIVWDSDAQDEYAELLTKTQILFKQASGFELLETMRWSPAESIYLIERHLNRLSESARFFAFAIDLPLIRQKLMATVKDLPPQLHKLRLRLDRLGNCQVSAELLTLSDSPQRVTLSKNPVSSDNVSLYHKTTNRALYLQAAESVPEGVEALLYNTDGYVTESVIANIVYTIDGQRYTPPLSDGLLPGTLREELLSSAQVTERSLHLDQLNQIESLMLVNALRGARIAELVR
jgi:para-aminobenzoate synthetase/4-amino-4-deoxychorismate lyase